MSATVEDRNAALMKANRVRLLRADLRRLLATLSGDKGRARGFWETAVGTLPERIDPDERIEGKRDEGMAF